MMKNIDMRTIDNSDLSEDDLNVDDFAYQPDLTPRLDKLSGDFDQNIINEIVLWKVNRYAGLAEETLALLNKIDTQSREMDAELTRDVLSALYK